MVKAVFALVYTGFSCLDEAKIRLSIYRLSCVQLTTCLIVLLFSFRFKYNIKILVSDYYIKDNK